MRSALHLFSVLLLTATPALAGKPLPPTISFVGCPADGQGGPVAAPEGRPKELAISNDLADRLAWYQAPIDANNLGTFAPRGWHCFATYGSNGAALYIAPEPLNANQLLFFKNWQGFTGPAIELSIRYSGTSGRIEVAHVIARAFPAHHDFAKEVMAEHLDPPANYHFDPFPTDKLHYHGPDRVDFTTPAHADGLGTMSTLKPGDQPITGFALLRDGMGLTQFNVRLPSDLERLAPVLINLEKKNLRHRTSH